MIYLIILFVMAACVVQLPVFKEYAKGGRVRHFLKTLNSDENYIVLHDLILATPNGKMTHIDHLVLSIYGVFVIETNNHKGRIGGEEKKKYWTQSHFGREKKFYSPIFQTYTHIHTLEQLIGCKPYVSIITFHPRVTIDQIHVTQDWLHITHDKQILKIIKQYKERLISQDELIRMENVILKNLVIDKNAINKKNLVEHSEKSIFAKARSCPKCGGKLVAGKGRYNAVSSCSNFPACRFVDKSG